jgi:nucleotide-binding universal stress UspA family protein
MKRVLVATDLSAYSARVMERGAQVAAQMEAELIVLHVVDSRLTEAAEQIARLRSTHASALDPVRKQLDAAVDSLRARYSVTMRGELMMGRPHKVITETAQRERVALVVIGAHTHEVLLPTLLGATSDRVLRSAHTPVLVVRNKASEPYAGALAALDFSDPSKRALEVAMQVAPQAALTLLHVIDSRLGRLVGLLGASDDDVGKFYTRARVEASSQLDKILDQCGVAVRERLVTEVAVGRPATLILDRAKAAGIDLVVLGRHGHEFLGQHLLGSIARQVLDASVCDVIVAPGAM